MNLSVVVVPAKVLADGMHKIRIAISHNCETRYKVTRFVVPSPKNVKNGRVVGKDIANLEYINTQLNSIVQRMYKAYDSITNADCYTCRQLLEMIESKINTTTPITFGDIAKEWLETKRNKCSDGSMLLFVRSVNCFSSFVGEDFVLSLLTTDIVNKYDEHLSKSTKKPVYNSIKKKPLSPTTINMRMRVLKEVVRYAEKRRYVVYDINPFIYHVERQERIRDAFLPVSTLRAIRDYKSDDVNEMIVRDIFMLSFYLCGMNLEDMLTLDFRGNSVSFIRSKTRTRRLDTLKTEFTIQPEARDIIRHYMMKNGHLQFCGKTKHTLSNYFERHFKKIENNIGSDKHLIFYSARKTFSQLAYSLKVQEMVIRFCIGDALTSKEKDMLVYYTKTEKRMADEAIRKVFDFVAGTMTEDELYNNS